MYSAFNLKLEKWFSTYTGKRYEYMDYGKKISLKDSLSVRKYFDNYLLTEGCLNGSDISNDWFPEISADIFLSHSHQDKNTALELAGFLHEQFGLRTFIDSSIWGHSNDLLKVIDNKYCLMSNGNYDYKLRNISTSHVHVMLTVALEKMIDKTECLFFLNTENSTNLTLKNYMNASDVTLSPWIYFELSTVGRIRRYYKRRRRVNDSVMTYRSDSQDLKIAYPLDCSNMEQMNVYILNAWKATWNYNGHPLDALYNMMKIK